ncbi:DUF5696 domain-containing protein [Nibricoccus sp. IMCC34717]|uniref:DUF5696 domain-containing protein n=1 Tax=Nibricoccus sp. IMCC34717 TaxID=3034021 RepID=UPI00384DB20D
MNSTDATLKPPFPASPLLTLDNEFLSVVVMDDGSLRCVDKRSGEKWESGPVAYQEEIAIEQGHVWVRTDRSMAEQYPARYFGVREGELIRYRLIGPEHRVIGAFSVNYTLQDDCLSIGITDVDEALPILSFPSPFYAASVVVPQGEGRWIRQPIAGRQFWPYLARFRMRWFGGLKVDADRGYLCIFQEGVADAGIMASGFSLFPVWQKSLERWGGKRTLLVCFTQGGYVGMAKRFRRWAQQNGLFKTLRQKAAENPRLAPLIGARYIPVLQAQPALRRVNEEANLQEPTLQTDGELRVLISHADAARVREQVEKAGVDRALFNLRGWSRGGYDYGHPDVWPPEPKLGTEEEMRELCRSRREGHAWVLHDNYQDIYEHNASWPSGVVIRQNRTKLRGGFWAPGQCYILNSRDGLRYAERNWRMIETLKAQGMYIDTVAATQLYESFEVGNEQTRSQNLENKAALLRLYSDASQVTLTEEGGDFAIPHVHACETWKERAAGDTVPLWSLVYHDCTMNYRIDPIGGDLLWGRAIAPFKMEDLERRWLEEILYGYGLATWALPATDADRFQLLLERGKPVDEWFSKIAAEEMTDHRYLSDDWQVEQVTYASGHSVIVNFSDEAREAGGRRVAPRSYVLSLA